MRSKLKFAIVATPKDMHGPGKYAPLIDALASLPKGKSVSVATIDGKPAAQFRHRMATYLYRRGKFSVVQVGDALVITPTRSKPRKARGRTS